jgi:hypothetical protein
LTDAEIAASTTFFPDQPPHLAQQRSLVLPVVKEGVIPLPLEDSQALLKEAFLLRWIVGPQGNHLLLPVPDNQQAEEVGELAVEIAFCVKVDSHGGLGEGRLSDDENSFLPDRQRVQRQGSWILLRVYNLVAAGVIGVRKLRDRQSSRLGIVGDLLFGHVTQEAQVVRLDGLFAAFCPEMAQRAMVIQDEPWSLVAAEAVKDLLCSLVMLG